MDFIGGALPNVMFLIGVIAIGIGLGLEFQIIQVKNGLSRGGRIGACALGLALIVTSIALYLRPSQTAAGPAPVSASAATVTTGAQASPAAPTPVDVPTTVSTPVPTSAPPAVPTVAVPDIRGMSPKDAGKALEEIGLQLGEPVASCAELGVAEELWADVRKGRIACQSVEPGGSAPAGGVITYALNDPKRKD